MGAKNKNEGARDGLNPPNICEGISFCTPTF